MTTWALRDTLTPPLEMEAAIQVTVQPSFDQRSDFEIQRTTDDGGSPDLAAARTVARLTGGQVRHTDWMPLTGEPFWYRARAVKSGWLDSTYTGWVQAVAQHIVGDDLPRTVVTDITMGTPIISDTTGADRLLVTAPQIAVDSAGNSDLEDGDAIVFSFDKPPNWWPSQTGLVWETTLVDGDTTSHVVRLENVTSSGADVVGQLQQPGAATNRDDNFAGPSSSITTVGGTLDSDDLTIAQLPAHNNSFTIRGKVKFANTGNPLKDGFGWANVEVKIYSRDGILTTYTLRDTLIIGVDPIEPGTDATVAFGATVSAPEVDGDTGDRFRIEVSAFNTFGPAANKMTFECWGINIPGFATNGVAWQTLSATTVSATDATVGATVRFLLMDADNIV